MATTGGEHRGPGQGKKARPGRSSGGCPVASPTTRGRRRQSCPMVAVLLGLSSHRAERVRRRVGLRCLVWLQRGREGRGAGRRAPRPRVQRSAAQRRGGRRRGLQAQRARGTSRSAPLSRSSDSLCPRLRGPTSRGFRRVQRRLVELRGGPRGRSSACTFVCAPGRPAARRGRTPGLPRSSLRGLRRFVRDAGVGGGLTACSAH